MALLFGRKVDDTDTAVVSSTLSRPDTQPVERPHLAPVAVSNEVAARVATTSDTTLQAVEIIKTAPEESAQPQQGRGHAAKESIEEILVKLGANPKYVKEAIKRKADTGESLPVVVRDMGLVSQEMVAKAIAQSAGYRYFSREDAEVLDLEVAAKLLKTMGSMKNFNFTDFIPIGIKEDGGLEIAVDSQDRANEARNTFIAFRPSIVIASAQTILFTYRRYFARTEEEFKKTVEKYLSDAALQKLGENGPVTFMLLCSLLRHACYVGASDIYLWPTKCVGKIALKIDGKGQHFATLRPAVYVAMMTLLMGSCKLTDALKLGPQEAKIEFPSAPDEIKSAFKDIFSRFHFRMEAVMSPDGMSTSAVIRVNDSQGTETDFSSLPFDEDARELILSNITAPTGLILVTGPTGSGKTTTLYSTLREINPIERRTFSVEYPIEYRNGMWIQHELPRPKDLGDGKKQTEGEIAREYLKALLRSAPDVILLGEVRDDLELVKTLLAAANTGHLVFTTLHTNSAAKAILRLLELGASREALAAVLRLAIAQRLLAKLCEHCKKPDERPATRKLLTENGIEVATPFRHTGCSHCGDTGYRGRRMIYEILDARRVREHIERGESISKIEAEGITRTETMWHRGLQLVAAGVTSVDELLVKTDRE